MPADIVLGNVGQGLDGSREDTSAQGRIGDDGDVELGAGFGNVVFEDVG